MAKYHPIGLPMNNKKILNLSNREVKMIRMMRKVEGDNYFGAMNEIYKKYEALYNELEGNEVD